MSPVWKRIAAVAFLTLLALWVVVLVGGLAQPRVSAELGAASFAPLREETRPIGHVRLCGGAVGSARVLWPG